MNIRTIRLAADLLSPPWHSVYKSQHSPPCSRQRECPWIRVLRGHLGQWKGQWRPLRFLKMKLKMWEYEQAQVNFLKLLLHKGVCDISIRMVKKSEGPTANKGVCDISIRMVYFSLGGKPFGPKMIYFNSFQHFLNAVFLVTSVQAIFSHSM